MGVEQLRQSVRQSPISPRVATKSDLSKAPERTLLEIPDDLRKISRNVTHPQAGAAKCSYAWGYGKPSIGMPRPGIIHARHTNSRS